MLALFVVRAGPVWPRLPFGCPAYVLGLLTLAYYFAVFAMSWDLLFGFAGEVNFGPTFLVGLGAYGAGLLNSEAGWPVPACVAGGAVARGGGRRCCWRCRRCGCAARISAWSPWSRCCCCSRSVTVGAHWTGGEIGLSLPDVLSIDDDHQLLDRARLHGASPALVLLVLSRSPVGLILQACGQDPVEAAALGFNVAKHKLAAFCVSALFSGLAGAMLVFYFGTVSPGTVIDIAVGVQVIIAAVLGGRRTIIGAAIGAVFLIVAGELLRPLGQLSTFVVSAVALWRSSCSSPTACSATLLHRRDRAEGTGA